MTFREWCLKNNLDPKSRAGQRLLSGKGILQKNGQPTPAQIAQGNFVLVYSRGVGNRKTPKVVVTERGQVMLKKVLEGKR